MDGVLLGGTKPGYGIMAEACEALRKAAREGVRACIVTGRDDKFITRTLSDHGLGPGEPGAPSALIADERCIHTLSGDRYVPYSDWNERLETKERQWLAWAEDRLPAFLDRIQAIDGAVSIDWNLARVRGYVELRFSNVAAAQQAVGLLADLCSTEQAELSPVRNVMGVTLRHTQVGKGPVLAKCAEILQVPNENVLAVGDSENDRSMLNGRFGFRAATVANAEPAIKELVASRGGYIAAASFGAGVAEILEKVVLNP